MRVRASTRRRRYSAVRYDLGERRSHDRIFTPVTITGPAGRERTAHIHEFVCLWYKPFHTRPVKVILIRNPGRSDGKASTRSRLVVY